MSTKIQKSLDNAQHAVQNGLEHAQELVDQTAGELVTEAQHAAIDAQASIRQGLRQVRDAVPQQLSRAAHRAEDLARAGIDKARAAGSAVAHKAQDLGERTTDYVREKPTQALLMAAAAGAATTLLVGWALRRRDNGGYGR